MCPPAYVCARVTGRDAAEGRDTQTAQIHLGTVALFQKFRDVSARVTPIGQKARVGSWSRGRTLGNWSAVHGVPIRIIAVVYPRYQGRVDVAQGTGVDGGGKQLCCSGQRLGVRPSIRR